MASGSQRQTGRDDARTTLDAAIQDIDHARDTCGILPAQVAFGSVSDLLTMTEDSMVDEDEYVKLGLECADICQALDRGLHGRRFDQLSKSVLGAIEHLTNTVGEIQKKIGKRGKQSAVSRLLHAKKDKDTIATWRRDLKRILQIFNTELLVNNHVVLLDIQSNMRAVQEGASTGNQSIEARVPPGESPPPPPRVCFGRDDIIEKVIGFAENLEPIALTGAGGIGKTSIALTILHHPRIKARFGDNRRFIRCDRFPTSRLHFLARLSKVIGAGVENPEDLTQLRRHISSGEMILFLDNAESILDPQGTDAREIYAIVDELSRFSNICLGITSRISTIPPHCKRPTISTLSIESALDIFYTIYDNGGRSKVISDLVERLDFHALSITLLATAASHNMWSYDRLAKEWDTHRAHILQTEYNESLAATIELSLASPTFQKLGPNARELLGIIAFFPQGIDENNLDWLFPTIPDRRNIFDKFCVLSLTSRSNSFFTMLAPIRDHICPKDPASSPLLCATKDIYFSRLSVHVNPGEPGFEEARWIRLEDANVEHLFNVFTSLDTSASDVWDVCVDFMRHLYWHKRRQTILGLKIEGLPDDHVSKPECLLQLSRLFESTGNFVEEKRVLSHALKLERERGNDPWVARTLVWLSNANWHLDLCEEGIQQAKEALEIFERLGDTREQADCLVTLTQLLCGDGQLGAAEEAATRAIDLLSGPSQEFLVCQSHRFLGDVYSDKGEREKAIHHYNVALGIASTSNWHDQLFNIHYALARLFYNRGESIDAQAHAEQAKSHTAGDAYHLGLAKEMQARIWHQQGRLEHATSEALRASELYEELGAARDLGDCRELLREIEQERWEPEGSPSGSDSSEYGTPPSTPTDTYPLPDRRSGPVSSP